MAPSILPIISGVESIILLKRLELVKINVKIIKYDAEDKKVSLGIKQLIDDPWLGIESKFPLGIFGDG